MKLTAVILLLAVTCSAQDGHVFDRKYWSVSAIDLAALGIDDGVSSARVSYTYHCSEINSVFGSRVPSPARYTVVMLAISAGAHAASAGLKKLHFKLWEAPLLYDAGTHIAGAAHRCH